MVHIAYTLVYNPSNYMCINYLVLISWIECNSLHKHDKNIVSRVYVYILYSYC